MEFCAVEQYLQHVYTCRYGPEGSPAIQYCIYWIAGFLHFAFCLLHVLTGKSIGCNTQCGFMMGSDDIGHQSSNSDTGNLHRSLIQTFLMQVPEMLSTSHLGVPVPHTAAMKNTFPAIVLIFSQSWTFCFTASGPAEGAMLWPRPTEGWFQHASVVY